MYGLKVIETNEIAGEVVRSLVTVSRHRTMRKARDESIRRWGYSPPHGTKIVHTDGTEYDPPAGTPLTKIL